VIKIPVKELPKIKINGKTYYYDERLKQIRNVKDLTDWRDLNEMECFMIRAVIEKEKSSSGHKAWIEEKESRDSSGTMNTHDLSKIVRRYPVPSDSTPGKEWEVAEWEDGTFTCNCPSFCKGRDKTGQSLEVRRACKHIRRVMAEEKGIEV
jgi:hypothetical protein